MRIGHALAASALIATSLLCGPIWAYQNKISISPGYTFAVDNDIGLGTINGVFGPIVLTTFEYDFSNRINLMFELSGTLPDVLADSGDAGSFDEKYTFLTGGIGFKYYPRVRGTSDFRQQGDTSILITSQYALNPYVGCAAIFESFYEQSGKRSGINNDFLRGNRSLAGANLVTGTDIVFTPSWGLTFLLRYYTIKSLEKVQGSDIMMLGATLHGGMYFNF